LCINFFIILYIIIIITQAENLPQSLAEQFPSNLIPLRTTGDGNCLLHAISRALFGVEVPPAPLLAHLFHSLSIFSSNTN
jgi:hypothetical protein